MKSSLGVSSVPKSSPTFWNASAVMCSRSLALTVSHCSKKLRCGFVIDRASGRGCGRAWFRRRACRYRRDIRLGTLSIALQRGTVVSFEGLFVSCFDFLLIDLVNMDVLCIGSARGLVVLAGFASLWLQDRCLLFVKQLLEKDSNLRSFCF